MARTRHGAANSQIFINRNKGHNENVTAELGGGDTPIHTDPHGNQGTSLRGWDCVFTAVAPEPPSFKPLQQSLLETFGFTLLVVSQMG